MSMRDPLYDASNNEAAQLLMAMLGNAPSYRHVPGPILQWYHRRRSIALEAIDRMAEPDSDDLRRYNDIRADLDVIEFALQEQLKERTQ